MYLIKKTDEESFFWGITEVGLGAKIAIWTIPNAVQTAMIFPSMGRALDEIEKIAQTDGGNYECEVMMIKTEFEAKTNLDPGNETEEKDVGD